MAYSALPIWPLLLFGVLEPIALVWGYVAALRDPELYYSAQVPNAAEVSKLVFTPQALSLTLQLGNVLLLLAAIAVLCCWTRHPEIAREYLIIVALADIGHIYAAYKGLGPEVFWDLTQWNDMAYGNIGVSAFLHINRWLTVAGLFGKLTPYTDASKKKT